MDRRSPDGLILSALSSAVWQRRALQPADGDRSGSAHPLPASWSLGQLAGERASGHHHSLGQQLRLFRLGPERQHGSWRAALGIPEQRQEPAASSLTPRTSLSLSLSRPAAAFSDLQKEEEKRERGKNKPSD